MDLFEILRAFNAGDVETLRARVTPDVNYVIPGRAAVSGQFRGIDGVVGAFQRLRRLSGETIEVEPQLVVRDGDDVMFVARVTADHDGRTLDVVNAYAFRFEHGQLAAGRLFPGNLHAIEAFFGSAR
jgi:ketosteroid isomerase-like protein